MKRYKQLVIMVLLSCASIVEVNVFASAQTVSVSKTIQYGDAFITENTSDCYSEREDRLQTELNTCFELMDRYDDLTDVFEIVPRLKESIHSPLMLSYLYNLYEKDDSKYKKCIEILIVYIEQGGSITNIQVLSSLSANYNPLTIITRSGKQISGLVLTGNDNATSYGTYPGTTKINGSQTFAYNCHSYAWYYGGFYNSSDKMWINQPQPYTNGLHCHYSIYANTSLSSITPSNIQVGDIIVYVCDPNDALMISPSSEVWAHSAIVDHVTANGEIWVKSKWDEHEIFYHRVDNCPYYTGFLTNLTPYSRNLSVYRPKHSINSSLHANENYVPKDAAKHYLTCYYCGRYITSATGSHVFANKSGVQTCVLCGYHP